jgi:AcrR family transcriptional regulator
MIVTIDRVAPHAGRRCPQTVRTQEDREILTAARGVFLREGYAAAGMEVVARAAGVSTATLYAYFPSKAKLFEIIVLDDGQRRMAEPVREAFGQGRRPRPPDQPGPGLRRLHVAPRDPGDVPDGHGERRRFEAVAEYFLQRARDELGGAAISVIEDLVATGELAIDKPAWAAGQLLGMLDHATLVLGLTAGDEAQPPAPLEDICADAVETFLARYGA